MRFIFVTFLFLSACSSYAEYERFGVHTGVTVKASEAYVRTLDAVARVEARVLRLSKGDRERFVLKTFVIRSDRNYPKILDAFSLGHELDYHRDDRHRIGVFRAEAGHVDMSAAEGSRRAQSGYSFLLSGPRGHYPFNIPPKLFAQIAGLAQPP